MNIRLALAMVLLNAIQQPIRIVTMLSLQNLLTNAAGVENQTGAVDESAPSAGYRSLLSDPALRPAASPASRTSCSR